MISSLASKAESPVGVIVIVFELVPLAITTVPVEALKVVAPD